jgi:hypothetical protein
MGADKNSSQELGLCPQITSEESRTHLPRSRSHNGPTDPRNKLEQSGSKRQTNLEKNLVRGKLQQKLSGLPALGRYYRYGLTGT